MIDAIHVENLALIRSADLEPAPGLTVLTGETGAGKTALLSALKLLMGERADSSQVREGTDAAQVTGRLFRDAHDTEGVVVERRLGADGRSRIKIDGSLASVKELRTLVSPLVDLCGQHEHQRLLDAESHVAMIDAWGASTIGPLLSTYRVALHEATGAAQELARVEEASQTRGARLEEARYTLERIDEVNPVPGEYEELEERLPRATHAESLARAAHDAAEALSGEGGALDALNSAIVELSRMGSVDAELSQFADTLTNAAIVLEDSVRDLHTYRDRVDFDPDALARAQARFSELKGLMRRFGPTMDEVLQARDEARELLSMVDDAERALERAQRALDEAEERLQDAARALSRARAHIAPRFCREVVKQMARLQMGRAELVWDARSLPRARWTKQGPEAAELLYKGGPGLTPRPLKRIASGGELSRVMLACTVVLGEADGVDTLVFDEVDAGVGGAVARSLAAVLADLAQTHQVIVVTHVAQVAVMATKHYVVTKLEGDIPETTLSEVTGEDRVREIARILSGDVSEVSCAHARQMLEEAGQLGKS
ncbi:MAG TPA: DNA repair protein RecN [Candidatus Limicola stercorigallinarum]|nr:DNA repair protein RecN [Candidatus Limicola stercorigallinarum]